MFTKSFRIGVPSLALALVLSAFGAAQAQSYRQQPAPRPSQQPPSQPRPSQQPRPSYQPPSQQRPNYKLPSQQPAPKQPDNRQASQRQVRPPSSVRQPATVKAPKGHGGTLATSKYAATHGVKIKGGSHFAYKGIGHRHWSARCYSAKWRCWCWYCPCTSVWYYWCGDRGLYLPVVYLTVIAPTTTYAAEVGEDFTGASEVAEVGSEEELDLPDPPSR
jgi:hypothetical protein